MDIAAIGRQFGLDEAQTRAALDALAPVVAAGMRRSAQTPEGLQEIFKSVLTGGYGDALEDEQAISLDQAKPAGDDILGQIFGNKEASREVAQRLSATSGIGAAVLKKLLPVIAMIVMGALAKKMGVGRANADTGGGRAGGGQKPQADSGGGLGDILKDVLGGGQQPLSAPRNLHPHREAEVRQSARGHSERHPQRRGQQWPSRRQANPARPDGRHSEGHFRILAVTFLAAPAGPVRHNASRRRSRSPAAATPSMTFWAAGQRPATPRTTSSIPSRTLSAVVCSRR